MKKYNWNNVDWSKPNRDIARDIGTNTRYVKKVRNQSKIRKNKWVYQPRIIDYSNVNWSKNNVEISKIIGCNRKTVSKTRKRLGKPPAIIKIYSTVDWENVNWDNKTVKEIAKEVNCSIYTVYKHKIKFRIPSKKPNFNLIKLDWSLSDSNLAKQISCSSSCIAFQRLKQNAPFSPIKILKLKLKSTDWEKSNREIAKLFSCDKDVVSKTRKRLGKPPSLAELNFLNKLKNTKKLSESHPEIAAQWHPTKNGSLTPRNVTAGSHKKIHWKCKNGHETEACIYDRVRHSCIYCTKFSPAIPDLNDCLQTVLPEIAAQWHPTKNGSLTPRSVRPSSGKTVHWKCKNGHEFVGRIDSRKNPNSCPYCSGQKVCKDNCLETRYPAIAAEWDFTKNNNLTPKDVVCGSNKIVYWKCKKGHECKNSVNRRVRSCGCPHCKSYFLLNGEKYNSLIECHYVLQLYKNNIEFIYNGRYSNFGRIGRRRFDFYLPEKNEYVEVTSFKPQHKKIWPKYIKNIEIKKQYVEGVLKAKFTFISKVLTKEETAYVKNNLKKDILLEPSLFDF